MRHSDLLALLAVFVLAAEGPPAAAAASAPADAASLGVGLSVGAGCPRPRDVCVTSVRPGGAAERAGIQVGDVLRRIGSAEVADVHGVLDAMQGIRVGDSVQFVMERQELVMTMIVRFTAVDVISLPRSAPPPPAASSTPYEKLPLQADTALLLERVRDRTTAVWLSGDVLSIVRRDPRDQLQIFGSIQLPMLRIPNTDVWALQLRMNAWEDVFLSYRFFSPAEPGDTEVGHYRGRTAPELPASANPLRGRIDHRTIRSKHLDEQRSITVYSPPGPADARLPAIFMADGEACVEFAMAIEPLITSGRVAPLAIVGVHSAPAGPERPAEAASDRRSQEYLPGVRTQAATRHMRFFVEEAVPWSTREYGLSVERSDRAIFGFSSGAAFAISVATEHPDLYAHVLPFSLGWPARPPKPARMPRYFFAAGRLEPQFAGTTEDMHELVRSWGGESTFRLYASGHDQLMWKVALISYLPDVFPPQREW